MINDIRDNIISVLENSMQGYSFYKRISKRIDKYPAIIVDLRSDKLVENGTSDGRKAYNSVYRFDIWCIYSEIQSSGTEIKDIDEAEKNAINGVSQIRDLLLENYGEQIDYSEAQYDEVYINGGHQFAGIIPIRIGEIIEHV